MSSFTKLYEKLGTCRAEQQAPDPSNRHGVYRVKYSIEATHQAVARASTYKRSRTTSRRQLHVSLDGHSDSEIPEALLHLSQIHTFDCGTFAVFRLPSTATICLTTL
jgi:hypothetical protein